MNVLIYSVKKLTSNGKMDRMLVVMLGLIGLLLVGCVSADATNLSTPQTAPTDTVVLTVAPLSTSTSLPATLITPEADVLLSQYAPNIIIGRVITFTGQVTRGEIFEKEIDNDLVFCLVPLGHADYGDVGWEIKMAGKSQGGCDYSSPSYSGLVSPPFHGPNPIYIEGWHFRNEDNTGPNDGTVNAPQENRWFQFVFNEQDRQIVLGADSCTFRNECADTDPEQARDMIAAVPKSRAIMAITHLELGNLIPDEQAWIEYMEFEVEIPLPESFKD